MTEFEKWQEKKRERKQKKKIAGKLKRENELKMAKMSEKEIRDLEANRKALGMLVGDVPDNESDMEFTGDANDSRFAA